MHVGSGGRHRNAARRAAIGVTVVLAIMGAAPCSFAQFALDERLIGTWIRGGSADRLEIRRNGDIVITFSGQASVFNGLGSIERCVEGGANLCIVGERLKCSYRYVFSNDIMTLQYRGGLELPCATASGDYRRRD